MKVFNLRCHLDHRFEGWFGSEAERQRQLSQGLLSCPLCGSLEVSLLPSAPHVQIQRRGPSASDTALASEGVPDHHAADSQVAVNQQTAWVEAVQRVMANTEDVGSQFADEARRIHYGEATLRGIRGQATLEQSRALLDEGIEVVPLVLPQALKGRLQ